MTNRFKVFIPFYNVEKWIKKTIRSVKRQNYKNFECILIDDMSTDNSVEIAQQEIENDNRFRLIKNTEKKFVLKNLCDAIKDFAPAEEDIIVVVDGDDWLAKADVLSYLNNVYESQGCWLTYGSYVEYPSMIRGKFAKKIPAEIVQDNKIREYPWVTGHLQTFKYGLWKKLDKKRSFTEPNNPYSDHHFMYCWDLAWMIPLVELAGKKSFYTPEILYVYNRENPLNCDKIKHQQQLLVEQKVRNMVKYEPLEGF
jgi:glycosyltransferase involved in cell wall biosynthesis